MRIVFFVLFTIHCSICAAQISYNMQLLANVNQHPAPHGYSIGITGYEAPDGSEYALFGCHHGTSFVNITDPENVYEAGFQKGISSDWRDIKIWSHYAYIVGDIPGCNLQIVDLQYFPDSIHYVASFSFPGFTRAHTLEQSGPFLYVNGGDYLNGGVFVLDLSSNPESPVKRGEWEQLSVHDCRIVRDVIWSCNGYSGYISVINSSNKNNLQTIASWYNGQNPVVHNCALTEDGRYLFVTDETFSPPGRLKIWNVGDLNNVQFIRSWHPSGIDSAAVHNVEINGSYALLAYYTAGVRVLDISDPENPTETAWYDTYPADNGNSWNGCKGIYMLPSGKIIANDKQKGLFVLKTVSGLIGMENNRISADKISLNQNYPNPFNPVTKIKFDIPTYPRSKGLQPLVLIKVYDVLGNEVATPVSENLKPGTYEVEWDGSYYPSGVYYYTLTVNEFKESGRMVLIK
jgi:choice-of-anchor B domain-containing protein